MAYKCKRERRSMYVARGTKRTGVGFVGSAILAFEEGATGTDRVRWSGTEASKPDCSTTMHAAPAHSSIVVAVFIRKGRSTGKSPSSFRYL